MNPMPRAHEAYKVVFDWVQAPVGHGAKVRISLFPSL